LFSGPESAGNHILGQKPLGVVLIQVKKNLLPLLQTPEAISLYGTIVDENGISILNFNYTESLGIIEPDNLPSMHRSLMPP